MSLIRTRWAALGAAVAITLGAGGVGLVSATVSSGVRTVFVPIEPCRIMDTRPPFQVGPRGTPIGAQQTHTVSVWGDRGDCSIPNDAAGLALNVTAVDATLPTFLTIWGDGTRPTASSLNPTPGQPPTPNAVTTDVTDSVGQFKIFNLQGSVHVLADVVGYYADHDHDDRYYSRDEIDQRSPRVNTITVGSAAFTPIDTGSTVIKSTGTGGAYVFDGPGSVDRLVAPLVLPDGVNVTTITVHHLDSTPQRNLTFSLRCERLDAPGAITTKADATSSGASTAWRTSLMASLPEVIDTDGCAYFLEVAGDWNALAEPERMRIGAFEITYQTPG